MNPRKSLYCAMIVAAIALGVFIFASQHVAAQSGGALSLVSTNVAGTSGGNSSSSNARSSADGRYVVFASYASNLTNITDNNNVSECFCP